VQGAPESIQAKAAGRRPGLSKLAVPFLGPSRRANIALEPFAGCIVWGCWGLKREFHVELHRPTCPKMLHQGSLLLVNADAGLTQ
jgi:hypothetical protein